MGSQGPSNQLSAHQIVPPPSRHVLPDEVSKPLGQGQGGRQCSAYFEKSLHRIFCFPFFIFVFEPLVFRLLFLYASVNFIRHYLLSTSLMKSNNFHYSFPLILCLVYSEFLLFIFSFQLPNKKENERTIFTYSPPSSSMVFVCLITSFIYELIKERKAVHQHFYPEHQRTTEDRVGMPPSYMVVQMIWDEDERTITPKANSISSFSQGKRLTQDCNLLKIHVINSPIEKASPITVEKLAVMVSRLIATNRRRKSHSRAVDRKTAATENYEEICRLLTNNFNIFVVSSAVGVAVTLALKNQSLNLKQQSPGFYKSSLHLTVSSSA